VLEPLLQALVAGHALPAHRNARRRVAEPTRDVVCDNVGQPV
jgi:hypothetical protein